MYSSTVTISHWLMKYLLLLLGQPINLCTLLMLLLMLVVLGWSYKSYIPQDEGRAPPLGPRFSGQLKYKALTGWNSLTPNRLLAVNSGEDARNSCEDLENVFNKICSLLNIFQPRDWFMGELFHSFQCYYSYIFLFIHFPFFHCLS